MERPGQRSNGSSELDIGSLGFVEDLYVRYLRDAGSVTGDWREYFGSLEAGDMTLASSRARTWTAPRIVSGNRVIREAVYAGEEGKALESAEYQDQVNLLVRNYRVRGHIIAQLDPLERPQPRPPELELRFYGFDEHDLDRRVYCIDFHATNVRTLGDLIACLRDTYCRSIAVQYMHIDDLAIRRWLQERMELSRNRLKLSAEEQRRMLTRLTNAVIFEEFIRKKYVGAKTFSLEGCESLIPLLDLALEKASHQGVREVVIGMAHRGRLNVLTNVVGKSPRAVFEEFEDVEHERYFGRGDVRYHLGYSGDRVLPDDTRMHLSLCFNPSHLEFVDSVVLGRVRAKQERLPEARRGRCMALIVHGDAAFAGEGIVQETLNLSQLPAYTTGGTLHVIVNNQIGFTTSPEEGRASRYATEVARMLQVPIFHVNGEDPEAVAQAVSLAMDYRHAFKRDVFVEMFGYRRWGHNETDEPSFTQPLLYRSIARRKPVREGYLDHLLQFGDISRDEAESIARRQRAEFERELSAARDQGFRRPPRRTRGIWIRGAYKGGEESDVPEVATAVQPERITNLLAALTRVPDGFRLHPKLKRILDARRAMGRGEVRMDWATAEALALATLATEGVRIRLTGQDTARGTFSQRHAVLHDQETGETYTPLQNLAQDQAPVTVANSPLSEAGVLGFEYGYSLDCPDGLVLWEAQFGDFANAAQVIIDQFIASAEDKWQRLSGLVLLLPHGFEGQGPEHSSARLERFLDLAAEDNFQVVFPSSPVQLFHCLRRQALRLWRKPLIVLTPKGLLRHRAFVSDLSEFGVGGFRRVITRGRLGHGVSRVLMATGKMGFELERHPKDQAEQEQMPLVYLEQLYPLPRKELEAALDGLEDGTSVIWVQEEPENMGAWRYLRAELGERLLGRLPFSCVCRRSSASPATGSLAAHKVEQQQLLKKALEA
jgi:2-oxoglutarate dehydrogenase E1 component